MPVVAKRMSEQLAEESLREHGEAWADGFFTQYNASKLRMSDFADYCWYRAEKAIVGDRQKKRSRRRFFRAVYHRLLRISLGYTVATLLGKLIVVVFL